MTLELRGVALHRGVPSTVRLSRTETLDIRLARDGGSAALAELRPTRTDRGLEVSTLDGRVRVDLFEHLLAAIGGLGVGGGLLIEVDADELPLLDGGALRFVEALEALDLPRARTLAVTRPATYEHGPSRYRFAPGATCEIRVEVSFPPPIGKQRAAWGGDAADFATRIAPARTFGFAREREALRRAGRAAHVDLASVLVLGDDGPVEGCEARGEDEPARHKLLDLVGDLALHGGPLIGVVDAFAPGHTATHAVVAMARADGVLAGLW